MSNEPSARIVTPAGGAWLSWLGHPARWVAESGDTGGTYALSWSAIPPGDGPPPHRHDFQEGFYVLKGELRFTVGNRSVGLPAGGFVSIGGGTAHTFENAGPGEAEVLTLVAPAGFERFQAEAGRPVAGPSGPFEPPTADDLARMKKLGPTHGIDFDLPEDAFRVEPEVTIRQPGEGPAFHIAGDLYTFLAEGAETDGRYFLWEAIVPPGCGPPPHVQTREHEGFYVLDGELTFRFDDRGAVVGPGSFVGVPPGVVHSFRNETDRPCRQLLWFAPAGLEHFFRETGRMVADRSAPIPPPSPEEIGRFLTAAGRYGVEFPMPGGP